MGVRIAGWILAVVVALAAAAFLLLVGTTHGHIDEMLRITVRIVDRESGRPLDGALVAIVRYRGSLGSEYVEDSLAAAIDLMNGEDAWMYGPVATSMSTPDEITTIRASAYVTRYWVGPILVSKEVGIPDILLIEHARLGRTIVPIDQNGPIAAGDEPKTWRLDLGTVRVPQ